MRILFMIIFLLYLFYFFLGRVAEVVMVLCSEAQHVYCYVKEVKGEVAEL